MEITISVTQLAPSGISRARGHQAFENLQNYLSNGPVEIDLNHSDLLSISFLDELVLKLLAANQLQNVSFLVADLSVQQRLAHVAALRDARIQYRTTKGGMTAVIDPRPAPRVELKSRNMSNGR